MKIPITKPFFDEEDRRSILEPLKSGWVVQGPKVAEFERKFKEYTNSDYAVACSSGTTALQMTLMAIDIGEGDEVILPPFTWVATANVIEIQKAKPVFVDIELDSFHIDVSLIEKAITPKTKAIIPVSLFGNSAEMDAIRQIADKHHLIVIEDDACALGTRYREEHAGNMADMACFSFHPRKAITTGEGGMVITKNKSLFKALLSLRDHGTNYNDDVRKNAAFLMPEFDRVGSNFRLTDIQGAVGVSQMSKLEWVVKKRKQLAERYDKEFCDLKWLKTPTALSGCDHAYQAYVCLFSPDEPSMHNVEKINNKRNKFMTWLQDRGIATRPGTQAVHALGFYRRTYSINPGDYPNAWMADQLSVALPLYAQMTQEEQDYVIKNVKAYCADKKISISRKL
jgi:perosamine synthetase